MAVKNVSHNAHDWRPSALRFGHWRDGKRLAFASTNHHTGQSAGRLDGHTRDHRFAVLVHLFRNHPSLSVEVDGVRIQGELGRPDDSTARAPFQPKPHRDGSLPRPTRPIAWVRWRDGRSRYLAECRVTQADPTSPWQFATPYAVDSDDRRLLPRAKAPFRWSFSPGRAAEPPLDEAMSLLDISLTGAGLRAAAGLDAENVVGRRCAGALRDERGRSLPVQIVVCSARPAADHTLLGVALSGMGLFGIQRLGRWLADH